jgi:hypothetical protein
VRVAWRDARERGALGSESWSRSIGVAWRGTALVFTAGDRA